MDSYNYTKPDDFQTSEKNHPKTIILHKDEFGFGFTLRHFIVYPPSNLAPGNLTLYENEKTSVQLSEWKPDEPSKPMDTIFIREVKEGSPAHQAGLVKGDRIIAINNHSLVGKSYSDIIHLILESGNVLQLLVVPKEDDILQLYFASSAYEPVNRECKPDCDSEFNYLSSYNPRRKYLVKKKNRKRYVPRLQSATDDQNQFREVNSSASYEFADSIHDSSMKFDSYADSSQSPINDSDNSAYFCNQSEKDSFLSLGGTREDVQNRNDGVIDQHSQLIASSRYSFPPSDSHRYSDSPNLRSEKNLYLIPENGINNKKDNPDNISPINFVAKRCHQFESGSLLAESLERMQMYKSELSRMSKSSQSPIVSTHTAHFETLSSKTLIDMTPETDRCDVSESLYSELMEPSSDYGTSVKEVSDYASASAAEHVIYREKNGKSRGGEDGEEFYSARRVSYLRATADDQLYIALNHSNKEQSISDSSKSQDPFHDDVDAIDDETPSITKAHSKSICHRDDATSESLNSLYGWVICKTVSFEGKRSSDRSWRHVWAILRNNTLYMLKERREPDNRSLTNDEHAIDVACSVAKIASDYVKRKNVLRLSIVNGTEFLIQTESHTNMLKWLKALQHFECESKIPDWTADASVLEKAAAYEQRVMGNKTSAIAQQLSHPMKKLVLWYRSPADSSVMKARRSSHGDELALSRIGLMWCDRMVHSWKKVHNSATEDAQIGASLGVRLELTPVGSYEHIPLLVELCIHVIEERGLDVVGIYRIPGNNAAVSMLSDIVNKGLDDVALQDPRWRDVNVVSSLLKAFFRKLPEPLLTTNLYPKFICASKIEDSHKRLTAIKNVLQELPIHHFETLKFLMHHLKRIVENSSVNKMESRNLAIVFGPTLVRLSDNNMVTMVTDMSHQCHLIETMINFDKWLFQNGSPEPVRSPSSLLKSLSKIDNEDDATNSSSGGIMSSLSEPPQSFKPRTRNRQSVCKSKRSGIIEQDLDVFSYLSSEHSSFDKGLDSTSSDFVQKISDSSQINQNGAKSLLFPKSEERLLPTYNQLSNFANLKVKQFEMETKAMLKREGNNTVSSTKAGPMEWERIEKEWQKAKMELEEEDFLDRLADDPLFVSFLLSQPRSFTTKDFADQSDSLAGPKRHSLNAAVSDCEPELSSVNGSSKVFESVHPTFYNQEPSSTSSLLCYKSTENVSLKKSASLGTFESTPNVKMKESPYSQSSLPRSKTKLSAKSKVAVSSDNAYSDSQFALKSSQASKIRDNKILKIPSKPWKPSTSSISEIGVLEPGESTTSVEKNRSDKNVPLNVQDELTEGVNSVSKRHSSQTEPQS